jgi:hypothetical protein
MNVGDALVVCSLIIVGGVLIVTGNGQWVFALVLIGLLLL